MTDEKPWDALQRRLRERGGRTVMTEGGPVVIPFPERPREYDCPDCGREVLEFPPFQNPPGVCVYCEFLRETRKSGAFLSFLSREASSD